MTTTDDRGLIYCVRSKAENGNATAEQVTMKNDRPATREICADCGTKKFRIGR